MTDQAGKTVQYAYDAANQLQSVIQTASPNPQNTTAYGYDPKGNLSNLTDANTHLTQNAFDVLSQLKTETMPAGQTQTRNYDAAGNLTSLIDYNGKTTTYTYDALNRPLAKTPDPSLSEPTVSFTYTATGKRNTMQDASGTTQYTYDNLDRLKTKATPQGTLTYTYDAAGNVASMASNNDNAHSISVAYTYDTLNRLATVVDNRLPVGQNTTQYIYDQLVSGAVQRTYTYGSQRISQNQLVNGAWAPSFYGYDGLGSVRTLTDTIGTVTDTYDFDAFGNVVNSAGSTPNLYLYRGEQYDPDLNLYYLRARYFNPLTGRFLSTDPAAGIPTDPASLHKYLYAGANPVNRVDPTGWAVAIEGSLLQGANIRTFTLVLAVTLTLDCIAVNKWTAAGLPAASNWGMFEACKAKPKCICNPCNPPVGTLGYRVDYNPAKPHFDKPTRTWIPGDHWHLYKVGQTPPDECRCQWDPLGIAGPYPPPPAGAVQMNGTPGGGRCRE